MWLGAWSFHVGACPRPACTPAQAMGRRRDGISLRPVLWGGRGWGRHHTQTSGISTRHLACAQQTADTPSKFEGFSSGLLHCTWGR